MNLLRCKEIAEGNDVICNRDTCCSLCAGHRRDDVREPLLSQALTEALRFPRVAAWAFKVGLKMWSQGKAGDKLRDLALLAMPDLTNQEQGLSFMLAIPTVVPRDQRLGVPG